jgi:hypothetical protein
MTVPGHLQTSIGATARSALPLRTNIAARRRIAESRRFNRSPIAKISVLFGEFSFPKVRAP